MSTVSLPLSACEEKQGSSTNLSERGYYQRMHHSSDSYCRIENWLPDVKKFSFATVFVSLTHAQGRAVLKYRDEVKLRAAIKDQEKREVSEQQKKKGASTAKGNGEQASLEDPSFLDEMFDFIWRDWVRDPEMMIFFESLSQLRDSLDNAIKSFGETGAFIKLSNRSPKDATLCMTSTLQYLKRHAKRSSQFSFTSSTSSESSLRCGDDVNDDVRLIGAACMQALRCHDGMHALRLLLESDRVYTDLTTHQLYMEQDEEYSMSVAVRQWCEDVNPDWEFRLFVRAGEATALTVYNDFFFSQKMLDHREELQKLIMGYWDEVKDDIHINSKDYCIDFAVTPDLCKCYIIEINNFLPPMAGSGLFSYHDARDKQLLERGPFSFRLRLAPLSGHTKPERDENGQVLFTRSLPPALLAVLAKERLGKHTPQQPDSWFGENCEIM